MNVWHKNGSNASRKVPIILKNKRRSARCSAVEDMALLEMTRKQLNTCTHTASAEIGTSQNAPSIDTAISLAM